jgi:hypothetical protein
MRAEKASDEGRRLFEELVVTWAGADVVALLPPVLPVPLLPVVAAPAAVFVVLGVWFWGEEGETGTGELLEAGGAWDVTATDTVGVGSVVVATTTLCVAGTGTTVAVEVEVEAPSSGCALCAEQNEMNGSNSGST